MIVLMGSPSVLELVTLTLDCTESTVFNRTSRLSYSLSEDSQLL